MFGLDALELDGNLFAGDDVGAYASLVAVDVYDHKAPHRGKYPRNYRYQFCGQCDTCCPRGDPTYVEIQSALSSMVRLGKVKGEQDDS